MRILIFLPLLPVAYALAGVYPWLGLVPAIPIIIFIIGNADKLRPPK